ncbi:tRNA 2-thiouridine(34) synthase MnmA [bacterium]|nr:tRNA 2-thiouridine(34) synthase MnmA [candidate division CSSED10-310 bacterium]
MTRETVAVAMSGGMDSSVAAYLLKERGYRVVGMTLCMARTPGRSRNGCGESEDMKAAAAVAKHLNIDHAVVDCREQFEEWILRSSWREYAAGRTPNPCVHCNRLIKFGLLLEQARLMDEARLATGHYARIELMDPARTESQKILLRGLDRKKDQSYFLYSLNQDRLNSVLFPLGEMTKETVREVARSAGFADVVRGESQDACLALAGEQFGELLRQRFGETAQSGDIVDAEGRILGRHPGIHRFTIGQRRGLGIALGHPAYVTAIRLQDRQIEVSTDPSRLMCRSFTVTGLHWINPGFISLPLKARVKIRYLHQAAPARIEPIPDAAARVIFDDPQRAVTPGQAAVFYIRDRVLGGGTIAWADPLSLPP